MAVSLAIAVLLASGSQTSAFADQSDFGGKALNWQINGFSACDIVPAADGPRVVLKIRDKERGDAIQVQDEHLTTYDYIFGYRTNAKHKKVPILKNKILEKVGTIDISLKSARSAREIDSEADRKTNTPIFTKPGKYVLLLGYSFQSDVEPDLGGVCIINYRGD